MSFLPTLQAQVWELHEAGYGATDIAGRVGRSVRSVHAALWAVRHAKGIPSPKVLGPRWKRGLPPGAVHPHCGEATARDREIYALFASGLPCRKIGPRFGLAEASCRAAVSRVRLADGIPPLTAEEKNARINAGRRRSIAAGGERAPRIVDERVRLVTTAAKDGHTHVATFNDDGHGTTNAGPDGHTHRVRGLDVLETNGHRHELSTTRAA